MRFWQAMKIVDEGRKVRRSNWGIRNFYIEKVGNDVFLFVPQGDFVEDHFEYYLPCQLDRMAEDWEVVETKFDCTCNAYQLENYGCTCKLGESR